MKVEYQKAFSDKNPKGRYRHSSMGINVQELLYIHNRTKVQLTQKFDLKMTDPGLRVAPYPLKGKYVFCLVLN